MSRPESHLSGPSGHATSPVSIPTGDARPTAGSSGESKAGQVTNHIQDAHQPLVSPEAAACPAHSLTYRKYHLRAALEFVMKANSYCPDYPCGPHMKDSECEKLETCETYQAMNLLYYWLDEEYEYPKLDSKSGDAMSLMLLAKKHGLGGVKIEVEKNCL